MRRAAAIYRLDNRVAVVPLEGCGPVTYEIGPVAVIEEGDAAGLARGTSEALQASRLDLPTIPNLRGYASPVLAALGVSRQSLEKRARRAVVHTAPTGTRVESNVRAPDGRGLVVGSTEELPAGAPPEDIATAIQRAIA
jgi:hypothetical protein